MDSSLHHLNNIMITWPSGAQESTAPWSALSSAAPIADANAETLKLEARKLEALKLEALRLEALVADRMQNKADALSATQAQPQGQAAAPAPASVGSQKPSSLLPTTLPWQAATSPTARAAGGAAEAAPRAVATERASADSDRAVAARRQAEAEGLTLQRSDNEAGYRGVYYIIHRTARKSCPFKARVRRGGKQVSLGYFETAEDAALAYARTPEAQEEVRNAKPKPLTAEEALTVARAEGLTLQRSESASGYKGVRIDRRGDMRCRYEARLKRGGKDMYLGHVSWHVTQTRTLCVHTTILSQLTTNFMLTVCSIVSLPPPKRRPWPTRGCPKREWSRPAPSSRRGRALMPSRRLRSRGSKGSSRSRAITRPQANRRARESFAAPRLPVLALLLPSASHRRRHRPQSSLASSTLHRAKQPCFGPSLGSEPACQA